MTERELQNAVIELAEVNGFLVHHVVNVKGQLRNSTSVGFPDLAMVNKYTGQVIFAELKNEKGKLTAAQKEWGDALRDHQYHVWRPSHWADGTIYRMLRR